MRRLTVCAAMALVAACASAGAPPGGAERHTPPEVIAVSPDSGATSVNIKSVEFKFDEVVSDRATGAGGNLDQLFLISPRDGSPNVGWHRDRITVRPRKGFRANTAYRITMLPGISDLRGNTRKDPVTILFSTGTTFPPYSILGRVFDWAMQQPARNAYIEAIATEDTTLVYVAATDSSGMFEIGPLASGTYTVRALIDQNTNRAVDRNEKWDTTTARVTNISPTVELDAIERDSTPPAFSNVTVTDSLTLTIEFDKPLDPALPLQPALFTVRRADSTDIEINRVQWGAAAERSRAATDSIRRSASDTSRRPPAAVPPAAGEPRGAPPPPKPKALPPERSVVLTISPLTPLRPGRYSVSARGLRNLLGNSSEIRRGFTVAEPAKADSTARPPAGTPARPPRPPRSP